MKQGLKVGKKILPLLVIALTAYFFAKALSRNWEQVQEISLKPDALSVIGMLLLILSVISSGLLWGKIVNMLVPEKHISRLNAVRIHLVSWLLKYIPGQAGSFVNKLAWGTKNGYSKKAMTNSFIYENALLIFASILPTAPIILVALGNRFSSNISLFAPLLFVIPLVLIVNQHIFYAVVNWLFVRLKKQTISKDLFLKTKDIARLQLEFIIPRLLNGAGFVFIAAAILPVEPHMYLPLGAIYVLAGIVGMLAIFVPSGLGVREAVIVLLASAFFTPTESVVVSIAARFYATLADVGVFILYVMINKFSLRIK